MDGNRSTLRAEDLWKQFGSRWVVQGVSFVIHGGEIVGLLGPNGAGKTTSFYMVVGLLTADRGAVYLDGQAITDWPMYRRARQGIVYLPQESSVFRRLRVQDNIEAVLEMRGLPPTERRRRVDQILTELGLTHLARSWAYTLSGGERRRVEIARALALEPRFLLLDEPFTGVDPLAVREIQRILQKLKAQGIGVLITDHNVRDTLKITDRTYIITEGRILADGRPGEVAAHPQVRRSFLGEDFRWEA
ncbi:MAG: LPS export ABC transporter ATP-binding protein [Acidobacteria bacterium]|nr:LPS export ABC transporter ATP-binding protein [Acidobacteriota bacterium]MDW7983466.1 LPS export ABC transporter ATP-binding protein [Acidobacteriota bacterium]